MRGFDLGKCLPESVNLPSFFANKAGVLLEGGNELFVGNAAGYIRLNLAMPRSIIRTGLERIVNAIHSEKRPSDKETELWNTGSCRRAAK